MPGLLATSRRAARRRLLSGAAAIPPRTEGRCRTGGPGSGRDGYPLRWSSRQGETCPRSSWREGPAAPGRVPAEGPRGPRGEPGQGRRGVRPQDRGGGDPVPEAGRAPGGWHRRPPDDGGDRSDAEGRHECGPAEARRPSRRRRKPRRPPARGRRSRMVQSRPPSPAAKPAVGTAAWRPSRSPAPPRRPGPKKP